MDYKQKYEQALERARCYKELRTEMSIVFTELKESEDERIRRALIRDIGIAMPIETAKKYIDWLEKQGEHQQFLNKIQVGDELTKNERGQLVNLSQLERVAKPRNKQKGEQKPANKVEPKLHEGQWITIKE